MPYRVVIRYESGETIELAEEEGNATRLRVALSSASCIWVDIWSPNANDTRVLEEVFELHPVVIEDMLQEAPTPKMERFDEYVYLILHGVTELGTAGAFEVRDLDLFLGRNFLISVHSPDIHAAEVVLDMVRKKTDITQFGPAYLAYLMVDNLTERFLPLAKRLDGQVERIEQRILAEEGPSVLHDVLDLKQRLQKLRRLGLHQKEILGRMGRGEMYFVGQEARPFFRDAYDDFVRLVDMTDGLREMVDSAMDAYLSMQTHRMNEIMKVLTLISTIMLPLTFIAGVYGMNFRRMPELEWVYGYPMALGLMAATALGLTWFFHRRKWLS